MAQVVVYGPNGARTTANTTLTEADKAKGYTKSEYDRLLAGEIEGREGYEGATKSEPLTPDYAGDYGGEDASTPDSQRESVVGVGNTDYDKKNYSNVGVDGEVVVEEEVTEEIDRTAATEFAEGIPNGGEIVKAGDKYYILYKIPNTALSLSYEATENDIEGLYPLNFDEQSFRKVSEEDIALTVPFGNIAELYDPELLQSGLTPWEGFVGYLDKEAELRPWLEDEEMVFLLAEATLEGRVVTDAEWKTTNWWRTSTQGQRDWLLVSQGKPLDELPADAKSKLRDDKIAIRDALLEAEISNPSDELVNWISYKLTTGGWTPAYTINQIDLLSNDGDIDEDLSSFISGDGITIEGTRAGETKVENIYTEILGPVFGQMNDQLRRTEANKLRNDPNYEFKLREKLIGQKKSLFPQYAENATYEEFATPWLNFTNNAWGEQVDPSSVQFQEVLTLNNSVEASKYLTQQGLDLGKSKVVNEALQGLKAFGQGVRLT
tara:strand:+ start:1459 stop:2934 length:1476 start_codon:yes stop_codon:yes gene_type:complete